MKDIYQKPNFTFVPLAAGGSPSSSDCTIKNTWSWQLCGVDIGFGMVVFNDQTNCTVPYNGKSVCQHTGPANHNVFGS